MIYWMISEWKNDICLGELCLARYIQTIGSDFLLLLAIRAIEYYMFY